MTKPTILIIAGGNNSRFAPLNTRTHKGFLSLAGKPIITRALEDLKKHEFTNIVIVVSQKDYGDKGFSKYLKENNNLGLDIDIILQKEARGMGDALLKAKSLLTNDFVLASPYYFNLGQKTKQLWEKKQDSNADCVFSGTKTEHPELYGILDLAPNNHDKVLGVIEKPKREDAPSLFKIDSVYLFDKKFMDVLADTKEEEYALEKAISKYAVENEITWIQNKLKVKSIKYPWHLFRTFNQIIMDQDTNISEDATIAKTAIIDDSIGPIIIEAGARVGDFAKISGPCYIGKNCLVGDYSFIRGSSLETAAIVGVKTEVVRSILFEKSSIHSGYLADSILGHNTKIAAGLITANKRMDRKNIRVQVKRELIDSNLNVLGLITGEKVATGIGVKSMPGMIIGANSSVHPNLVIKRNVGNNKTLEE